MVKKKLGDLDIFETIKIAVKEVISESDLVTKKDLKYLPTKEEYYKRMDEMMAKLNKMETEFTVLNGRVSDHSDRIENLEDIHPNGIHSFQ